MTRDTKCKQQAALCALTTRGYETKIITEIRRLFLYFGRESFIIPPCKHAYQNPHSNACAHSITCVRMLEFALLPMPATIAYIRKRRNETDREQCETYAHP